MSSVKRTVAFTTFGASLHARNARAGQASARVEAFSVCCAVLHNLYGHAIVGGLGRAVSATSNTLPACRGKACGRSGVGASPAACCNEIATKGKSRPPSESSDAAKAHTIK
jgi:hypothetical protein